MTLTRASRAGGRSSSGQTATWVTSGSGAPRSRSWWSCRPGWGWSAPATCSATSATRSWGWTPSSSTSRWVIVNMRANMFCNRILSVSLLLLSYCWITIGGSLLLTQTMRLWIFWFVELVFFVFVLYTNNAKATPQRLSLWKTQQDPSL